MNISRNSNVIVSRLLMLGNGLKSLCLLALVVLALHIAGCKDSSGSSVTQSDQMEAGTGSSDSVQISPDGGVNAAIQGSIDALPDVFEDLQETAPIVFEPSILDLGKMLPRELVTSKFTIRNVGNKPMTIKVIRPSCGCTKLDDYSGLVIPPGQAVELEARTRSRTVPSSFTSSISFLFEEYIGQSTISMYGDITRAIRTAPKYFNCVANAKTGQRVDSGLIVVEALDGKPFNILSANGVEPIYQDFDPDFDEAQNSYILEWDISQYENINPPGWWIIETDNLECPVVDVWVRHEANIPLPNQSPWRVRANHIVVGGIKPGESAEFDVDIQNRLNTISPSNVVQSLSKNFNAKVISFSPVGHIPPDSTIRVRITPSPGYEGLLYGKIRFILGGRTQDITIIGKALESTEEAAQ